MHKKKMKLFLCLLYIFILVSCDTDAIREDVDQYLEEPPVLAVTKPVKTCVPIAYASALAMAHFKGHSFANAAITVSGSVTIIHINTDTDYPFKFNNDAYGDIIVVGYLISDNTAILSVFFTNLDISIGTFELVNIRSFPVVYREDRITAVYASNDINLDPDIAPEDETYPSQAQIDETLNKLNYERPESKEVAIEQNAWVVDVYHNNTLPDLLDDTYKIYGGEQDIKIGQTSLSSSSSVLQLAMIGASIKPDCIKNPLEGFAVVQEVEVVTSSLSSESNIILGDIFFSFHDVCDGKVEVTVATGNFIGSAGSEKDLDLN